MPEETVYGSAHTRRPSDVWPEMIKGARKTLELEQFYINDRGAMRPVLEAVEAAARRGVAVRVIVDSKFYKKNNAAPDWLAKVPGIEVRVLTMSPGVQHAKFFIVDGREVFVGSQNMDGLALTQIHELGIRIGHEAMARSFLDVFELDWGKAGGGAQAPPVFAARPLNASNPAVVAGAAMYPAFSPVGQLPPGYDSEIDALYALLRGARKTVDIQVMNYGVSVHGGSDTWIDLNEEIKAAAGRGVRVRLAVADWSFAKKVDAENLERLSTTSNVSVKYTKIPRGSGGFVPFSRVDHCKYMVVDQNTSWISTSNWQKDYFFSSRDATVVLESPEVARVLEGVFDATWNGPYAREVAPAMSMEPPEMGSPNDAAPKPAAP